MKAIVIDGRLAFIVDQKSENDATCINAISVVASGEARARPTEGDDVAKIRFGTFWDQFLEKNCIDKFPVLYGQQFAGRPRPLNGKINAVAAKPLKIRVVYEVNTTTGSTGYGSGAFKIMPDRKVVNVPPPGLIDMDDPATPDAVNLQ